MIIQEGYWNYYMSFRLSDSTQFFHDMISDNYSDTVIGVALNNETLENTTLLEYFEERKNTMIPIIKKKHTEVWDEDTEKQLYIGNKIPEYYFDFSEENGQLVDLLEYNCQKNIAEIRELNNTFIELTGKVNKERWSCMALIPLKIEIKPLVYSYCPIYIYLFENGHGVIKISIEISEIESSCFHTCPMQTWFGDVRAWQPLMNSGNKKEYKILKESSDTQTITIITYIMQQYIERLFGDNLLDKNIFSCFETFTIAGIAPKQLWEINAKGTITEKKELLCFANPFDFMIQLTNERWYEFWKNSYLHFNGFDLIKGNTCRLIISGNIDNMLKQFHRENVEDLGSYFNISIQRSFDLFLIIALCQKDSEFNLYRFSEQDIHGLDKQIAIYNQKQNFFENFLDIIPYNAREFYLIIKSINNQSFADVKMRTDRLRQIESYQRNLLTEKRTLLIEAIALIGTILFGLPTLYETLLILREVILPAKDLIVGNIVQLFAVVIWILIIILMSGYLLKAYKQYWTRKL